MSTKSFLKSKTLWFNVYVVAAYVLNTAVFGVETVPAPSPEVIAVINLILRLVTKRGLHVVAKNGGDDEIVWGTGR